MNNINIVIQKFKSYKFINSVVKTDPYIIAQEEGAFSIINGKFKPKGKYHQFLTNKGTSYGLGLTSWDKSKLKDKKFIETKHLYNYFKDDSLAKQYFVFSKFKSINSIDKIYGIAPSVFEKHNFKCKKTYMNFRTISDFVMTYSTIEECILQDEYYTSLIELNKPTLVSNFLNSNFDPESVNAISSKNLELLQDDLDILIETLNQNNIPIFSILENDLLWIDNFEKYETEYPILTNIYTEFTHGNIVEVFK
jgi:hypothetical protein